MLENVVEDGREGGEEGRASTSLKKSMVFLIYSWSVLRCECVRVFFLPVFKKEAGGLGLRGWERPRIEVKDEAQVVPCSASDPGHQDHHHKPAQTFVNFDGEIDTG